MKENDLMTRLTKCREHHIRKIREVQNELEPILYEFNWYQQQLGKSHADVRYKGDRKDCGDGSISNIEWDESQVRGRWETTWAYGGHDEYTIYMPLYVLTNPNWREDLQQEVDDHNKRITEAKEAKLQAEELAEYNRLKEKFEEK